MGQKVTDLRDGSPLLQVHVFVFRDRIHKHKFNTGGLLFTRDGSNLQYVASASMVLPSYARTLLSAHVDGVLCGSDHFTASQIRAFAKSQVLTRPLS